MTSYLFLNSELHPMSHLFVEWRTLWNGTRQPSA